MVKDIYMSKANLNKMINKCEEFANKEEHFSFDYLAEISKVKSYDNIFKAFKVLVETKVFYLVWGKFLNSHGNFITVED